MNWISWRLQAPVEEIGVDDTPLEAERGGKGYAGHWGRGEEWESMQNQPKIQYCDSH